MFKLFNINELMDSQFAFFKIKRIIKLYTHSYKIFTSLFKEQYKLPINPPSYIHLANMFDVILYICVLNCDDLSFRPYAHSSVTVLKFAYVINEDKIMLT